MNKNSLISFIIPVYNVEKYIEKLVNSIINQTYKNLEIILIDDGSNDNSPKIIDELAKKDDRIIVIHKKNGGVSSARNTGLEKSKGDIILFVDGDDLVDNNYAEYFYNLITKNDCDIAVNFNFYNVFNNKYRIEDNIIKNSEFVIEKMYYGELNEAVWNKAYKKNFLTNNKLLFDKEIWFGEGMLFNIKCFQYTDKIAIGNRKVYHQTWNPNSAMRNFNLNSNLCGIKSLYLQKSIWKVNTPDIELAWKYHLRCFNRSILVGIIKSNSIKQYKKKYIECKKNLRKDLHIILKAKISKNRKLYYLGMALFPVIVARRDIKKEKKYNNQVSS